MGKRKNLMEVFYNQQEIGSVCERNGKCREEARPGKLIYVLYCCLKSSRIVCQQLLLVESWGWVHNAEFSSSFFQIFLLPLILAGRLEAITQSLLIHRLAGSSVFISQRLVVPERQKKPQLFHSHHRTKTIFDWNLFLIIRCFPLCCCKEKRHRHLIAFSLKKMPQKRGSRQE